MPSNRPLNIHDLLSLFREKRIQVKSNKLLFDLVIQLLYKFILSRPS